MRFFAKIVADSLHPRTSSDGRAGINRPITEVSQGPQMMRPSSLQSTFIEPDTHQQSVTDDYSQPMAPINIPAQPHGSSEASSEADRVLSRQITSRKIMATDSLATGEQQAHPPTERNQVSLDSKKATKINSALVDGIDKSGYAESVDQHPKQRSRPEEGSASPVMKHEIINADGKMPEANSVTTKQQKARQGSIGLGDEIHEHAVEQTTQQEPNWNTRQLSEALNHKILPDELEQATDPATTKEYKAYLSKVIESIKHTEHYESAPQEAEPLPQQHHHFYSPENRAEPNSGAANSGVAQTPRVKIGQVNVIVQAPQRPQSLQTNKTAGSQVNWQRFRNL